MTKKNSFWDRKLYHILLLRVILRKYFQVLTLEKEKKKKSNIPTLKNNNYIYIKKLHKLI